MNLINTKILSATGFAPATCANVAVGFDILGFAIEHIGDSVTLTKREDNKLVINSITGIKHLPFDIEKNTASVVIEKLRSAFQLTTGFTIDIHKGIPLSSGLGGSAASAVAAAVAFNAFLNEPLSKQALATYALYGEMVASEQAHGDNIIPCIFGGLTLIQSINPINHIQLPVPDIYSAILHPHLQVQTKSARAILNEKIFLRDHIKQSINLATFIAALYEGEKNLFQQALNDEIIEPQRAGAVPGFKNIKRAALEAGAFGASFSGSGPSIFAFAQDEKIAKQINHAMQSELNKNKIQSDAWVTKINEHAAHLTQVIREDL